MFASIEGAAVSIHEEIDIGKEGNNKTSSEEVVQKNTEVINKLMNFISQKKNE